MEKKTFTVDGWFTEKVIHSLYEVAGAAWHARELEKLKVGSSLHQKKNNSMNYCWMVLSLICMRRFTI
jgi:hypothetical protein